MSGRRFASLSVVLLVGALVSVAPRHVAAQECTSLCNDCGWLLVIGTDGQPYNSTQPIDMWHCQTAIACQNPRCINVQDQQDLQVLDAAVARNDIERMAAVFARNQDIVLNAARNSLQVRASCNADNIVADYPLTSRQFAELWALAEDDQLGLGMRVLL